MIRCIRSFIRRRQNRKQRWQETIDLVAAWLDSYVVDTPAQWQTCGLSISPADIRQWFAGDTTSLETFSQWYPDDFALLDIDSVYCTWLAKKINSGTIIPIDSIELNSYMTEGQKYV